MNVRKVEEPVSGDCRAAVQCVSFRTGECGERCCCPVEVVDKVNLLSVPFEDRLDECDADAGSLCLVVRDVPPSDATAVLEVTTSAMRRLTSDAGDAGLTSAAHMRGHGPPGRTALGYADWSHRSHRSRWRAW